MTFSPTGSLYSGWTYENSSDPVRKTVGDRFSSVFGSSDPSCRVPPLIVPSSPGAFIRVVPMYPY